MALQRTELMDPRSRGRGVRLVWSLVALTLALMLPAVVLVVPLLLRGAGASLLSHQLVTPLIVVSYALLGGRIASRQPRNPIGWLFIASGLLASLTLLVDSVAVSRQLSSTILPGDTAALSQWLDGWLYLPALFLPTVFVFLYFPDGRLLRRRWRPLAWGAALGLAATCFGLALHPGPVEMWGSTVNPYGIEGWAEILDGIITLGSVLLLIGVAGSVAALVVRYRAARGVQRLQMKWLVYAAWIVLLGFALGGAFWSLWPESTLLTEMGIALSSLTLLSVPVAAAMAISRHRLYDIDLVIGRTLVYGVLTAVVVLLYVATVALTGLALQQSNRLAALLLTAALAAILLRPAQRRLQWVSVRLVGVPPLGRPIPAAAAGVGVPGVDTEVERADPEGNPSRYWWWRPARIGWLLLAAAALALLLLALPLLPLRQPLGNLGAHLLYRPGGAMLAIHNFNLVATVIAVLLSYALAALLYLRRPNSAMALFLAYFLLLHGLLFGGTIELLDPLWPGASALNAFVLLPALYFPLTYLLLAIFPNGRFVPRWSGWVALASLLAPLSYLVSQRAPVADLPLALLVVVALQWLIPMGVIVYAQIHRYRRVSTLLERQQTKWVLYGYLAILVLVAAGSVPWSVALALPAGSVLPWWLPFVETTWVIALAILPLTLTFAVLRYRLYAIDLLFNRTLVYGGLTGLVVAMYVLIVGALGTLFQAQDNLVIALLATGLIAALFQPLRAQLQQTVNRLVYGERDDPGVVLSRLGRRLEQTLEPSEIFPTLTETVAQALKLPYVAVGLRRGDDLELVAEYGRSRGKPERMQLRYQDETFGELIVEPSEAPFDDGERRLLETVAHRASAAAYTARLNEDLRRSRERLVSTREEERRRLRRDLHDGLGPRLASQALKLEAARELLVSEPERAEALITGLLEQSHDALQEVRRLVYGLRPPALDELGLLVALREYLTHDLPPGLHFELEAPTGLPSLPAAVEVAAYRIVQEAVTNVIRHAAAERCRVRLTLSPREASLLIEVCDDGRGLPEGRSSGVGLGAMRERAEELGGSFHLFEPPGGGTCLRAALPLPARGA